MKLNAGVTVVILLAAALVTTSLWNILGKQATLLYASHTPTPVVIASSTAHAIATGSYPQFSHASADFNHTIADTVNKLVANHLSISEDNYKAMRENGGTPPTDKFEISFKWHTTFSDTHRTSVEMESYDYSGGAHGNVVILGYTYDYDLDRILALPDLFPNRPYLNLLSTEARRQLPDMLAKESGQKLTDFEIGMVNDGTTPSNDNFSTWTIDPSGKSITVYFQDYQVASHVFGPQQIHVALPVH